MPVFEIERGGKVFEVDAPDMNAALKGFQSFEGTGFDQRFGAGPTAQTGGGDTQLRKALEQRAAVGQPSQIRSGLLGASQGLLMNFADEAAAGVNAAVDYATGQAPDGIGAAYDARLASGRQQMNAAQEANPGTFLAGQVAGGVAAAPLLPGVGAGVRGAVSTGALYGGVAGAGAGEGIEGRIVSGGIGAGVGGALGAVVPAAVEAAGAVGRGVNAASQGLQSRVRSAVNPTGEAARRVDDALVRDARVGGNMLGPDDFAASQARGQPVTTLDAGGEEVRALARSAANTSPEARATLNNTIDPRAEAQAPRVVGFIRNLVGTSDAGATRESLQQAARTANRPAYAKAYAQGQGVWDDELAQLIQAPAMQGAIRDATRRGANQAAVDGFRPVKNPFVETDAGFTLAQSKDGSVAVPNLQFWDVVKRNIDDQIGRAKRSGENAEAADLTAIKNQLTGKLDGMIPAYREARAGAARFFEAEDALEAGEKFVRSTMQNGEARRALSRMSDPERKMFAEGFASNLIEQVNRTGDRRNVVNAVFGSPASRERVEIALGKDKAREMEAFLRTETIMEMAKRAIQGNSTTTRQLVELGLAGASGTYGASTGDWNNAAYGLIIAGLSRGTRAIDQNVAKKVAEMLVSPDPATVRKAALIVGRNPRLMDAMRSAEEYVVKALGPAVNDNAGVPAASMFQGMRPAAASGGEAQVEEGQRP